MGGRIIALSTESRDARLTGALEVKGHPSIGRDAGIVSGSGELKVPITASLEKALADAEILIDFTAPSAIVHYAETAIARGIGLVIGSTALNADETAAIEKASKSVPVITAPNMSVGVNLCFRLAPMIAEALGEEYDIEIVEAHHNKKKDAPSGTALRLLDGILASRKSTRDRAIYGRGGMTGERPQGQIGVHAVRAGDIIGEHTVVFATGGERIELVHKAHSRDTFAHGALRAARFLAGRPAGRYSMDDVLFGGKK